MYGSVYVSPIGPIGIRTDDRQILEIELGTDWKSDEQPSALAQVLMRELDQYFLGRLHQFTIPFPIRGTPFKQSVLRALLEIPYGETVSYQDVAKKIGNPKACRAVGTACATNDLPLVIPCHRVIKSDHSVGRFGNSPRTKQWLIDLEKSHK
jgi:methylated-DNA-[protein]-cysteine S-methyltransferase